MNITLNVIQDPCPESPRTWGNLGILICGHKWYSLPNELDIDFTKFKNWTYLQTHLIKAHDAVVLLPIYMYDHDHAGVAIRTTPFGDVWDSGQVGFIIATREDILKIQNIKRITPGIREKIKKYLTIEVELYNQYLNNDVWAYQITDNSGNILESCSGFFDREQCYEEGNMAKNRIFEFRQPRDTTDLV